MSARAVQVSKRTHHIDRPFFGPWAQLVSAEVARDEKRHLYGWRKSLKYMEPMSGVEPRAYADTQTRFVQSELFGPAP